MVSEVVGFKGEMRWDREKPDETFQKLLDISQIKRLGWKPNIALKYGIRNVYEWYLKRGHFSGQGKRNQNSSYE